MKRYVQGLIAVFLVLGLSSAPAQAKRREFPAPVHPDTLPTLGQSWTLPASLAPFIVNAYAPRMAKGDGLVYVYDHHGRRLVAVKVGSGKVAWHAPVPSRSTRAFAVTPLVLKNRVYVASDGWLYSFAAAKGQLRWKLGLKGVAVNGVAHSKHHLLVPWVKVTGNAAQPGVHLWAVDSRRGRVEWAKQFPGRMAFVEGDAAGAYYVGSTGTVLGLTPDRGDYKWQVRIKGEVLTPPILKSGMLYVTTHRKKAGWEGTGLYAIDVKKGKVLWQTKLTTTGVTKFLANKRLVTVEPTGKLTVWTASGKEDFELELRFADQPRSLQAVAVGARAFVFSSHQDGNGYVWLVDLKGKRVLTAANALDMDVRSILPEGKALLFDGIDGNVYAYRMDRSRRPKRMSVPPTEFARDLLDRVRKASSAIPGLAEKLAGLGPQALPAIEPALQSTNPHVVQVAARSIGYIGRRRSVRALVKAAQRLRSTEPASAGGAAPLRAVIDALAELGDSRAVAVLKSILESKAQGYHRRRAAYVALGAIGSPAALAPIWAFRGARQLSSSPWEPHPYTLSYGYKVEQDVPASLDAWPDKIRRRTTKTIQNKKGQVYTASLSPYLGGYNDIWIGKSDLSGVMTDPLFTGLTKPEIVPNRRIKINKLWVRPDGKAKVVIQMKNKGRWLTAKPVSLDLRRLARDRDGDGLPDIVERRLQLCVTHPDCDGDGLKDSEDINPLASSKRSPTVEQQLFQEAFFTFFAFLERRSIVVVDPGAGPSFELLGRADPVLSLRRPTIEKLRKEAGLHAIDYVSFGGPYPEGGGSGDAKANVVWNRRKTRATIGMDVFRSADNAVAYNVYLRKKGNKWVVYRFNRVWTTNE